MLPDVYFFEAAQLNVTSIGFCSPGYESESDTSASVTVVTTSSLVNQSNGS